ncbi:MAG TPA: hypothetical protein VJ436_13590, partial [Anaerolineales bacterium]|nr:hypothetical protein [Anaerolineales bacterium]
MNMNSVDNTPGNIVLDLLASFNKYEALSVKQNHVQSSIRSQYKIRIGSSGFHIFDRTTGLNVLLDEVQIPPALWAAAPRQVSIALTNVCDLACPYCFAPKNSATLDIERVTSWLD